MRIVVQHGNSEDEVTARWLADAIKAQFSALISEATVVGDPKPIQVLPDIGGPFESLFAGLSTSFASMGDSMDKVFSNLTGLLGGVDVDQLDKAVKALEAANDVAAQVVTASPQRPGVHVGERRNLVSHSSVPARPDQSGERVAAAALNPVLPHADKPSGVFKRARRLWKRR